MVHELAIHSTEQRHLSLFVDCSSVNGPNVQLQGIRVKKVPNPGVGMHISLLFFNLLVCHFIQDDILIAVE